MSEQAPWPRTLFNKDEPKDLVKDSVTGEVLCGSRLFQSQEEVDAAGGNAVWKATPQEAQAAGTRQARPAETTTEGDESHTPRSRR